MIDDPTRLDGVRVLGVDMGSFYDLTYTCHRLGLAEGQVRHAASDLTVLAMATGDGDLVFPAWQFETTAAPVPRLHEVLRFLAGRRPNDPWTWALWLRTPRPDLDGLNAVQWLVAGRDLQTVIDQTARDAPRRIQ